jgi:hypothetical protein
VTTAPWHLHDMSHYLARVQVMRWWPDKLETVRKARAVAARWPDALSGRPHASLWKLVATHLAAVPSRLARSAGARRTAGPPPEGLGWVHLQQCQGCPAP